MEDRADGRPAADVAAAAIPARRNRIQLIDALRGFALLGILLVNTQSFTWGAGDPLGYFATPPDRADRAVFFVLSALVVGKFYPIFAFLFGAGLTLQTRSMRALAGGARRLASYWYRRRLLFLLAIGVLHGILLYFGDILVTYALCAMIVLPFAWVRTRTLAAAVRIAWAVAIAVLVFWTVYDLATAEPSSGSIPPELLASHEVYAADSYHAQLVQRLGDDLDQNIGGVFLTWPQVIALMLTGALAARLRWLAAPRRFPRLRRRVLAAGLLIGLPCALVGAALHVESIRVSPDLPFGFDDFLLGMSLVLSGVYVAGAAAWLERPSGRWVAGWLAPAGRMPLTLYLTQSVAMNVLLCGWGFNLAATATRTGLVGLAVAIYAVQLVAARLAARRFASGPMEWLWRRFTYRGVPLAPPPASSTASSTFSQSPR